MLPAAVLVRDRPEDLGLEPDGIDWAQSRGPIRDGLPHSSVSMNATEWQVIEVLRDRTFWKLLSVPATSGRSSSATERPPFAAVRWNRQKR